MLSHITYTHLHGDIYLKKMGQNNQEKRKTREKTLQQRCVLLLCLRREKIRKGGNIHMKDGEVTNVQRRLHVFLEMLTSSITHLQETMTFGVQY